MISSVILHPIIMTSHERHGVYITGDSTVCSATGLGWHQRKHQSPRDRPSVKQMGVLFLLIIGNTFNPLTVLINIPLNAWRVTLLEHIKYSQIHLKSRCVKMCPIMTRCSKCRLKDAIPPHPIPTRHRTHTPTPRPPPPKIILFSIMCIPHTCSG